MICPPCRQGGNMISYLKRAPTSEVATMNAQDKAAADHAKCKAPNTCTCQHEVTLDALNEKGLK